MFRNGSVGSARDGMQAGSLHEGDTSTRMRGTVPTEHKEFPHTSGAGSWTDSETGQKACRVLD